MNIWVGHNMDFSDFNLTNANSIKWKIKLLAHLWLCVFWHVSAYFTTRSHCEINYGVKYIAAITLSLSNKYILSSYN